MKTLSDITVLDGVKVLLRADFNVPIVNGAVRDDYRIRATLPTIEYLRKKGATTIIISHLESADHDNPSLEPVARHLEKIDGGVTFIKDWKKASQTIESGITNHESGKGQTFLLENLRFFEGEKKNDPKFAKELASLADIYVNDAFSVSHREHASIVGVPKYLPSYAGLQLESEVKNLSRAFDPQHPFLFILGGAKFETKLPLLSKFIEIADQVFVGGALSDDFYKSKGYEIGTSMVSSSDIDLSKFMNSPKLLLPIDITNQHGQEKPADGLTKDDKIMDSGSKTLELLKEPINRAKFILWNGPLGLYEDGYKGPTLELAKLISSATERGAETIVGGGDTLAAIASLGIEEKFTFMSTGGGAMLDFLAKGTLPGLEALEKSAN